MKVSVTLFAVVFAAEVALAIPGLHHYPPYFNGKYPVSSPPFGNGSKTPPVVTDDFPPPTSTGSGITTPPIVTDDFPPPGTSVITPPVVTDDFPPPTSTGSGITTPSIVTDDFPPPGTSVITPPIITDKFLFPTGTGIVTPPIITDDFPFPTTTGRNTYTLPGGTDTITEIITKTKFVPCSTAVGSRSGHTYYSTWLTVSTWTTTSCYPVTTTLPPPPAPPSFSPPPHHCPEWPSCNPGCPAVATVTVTVTECGGSGCTTTEPAKPTYTRKPPPHHCHRCQTFTFTDVDGGTRTVVIPPRTTVKPSTTTRDSTSQPTGTRTGTGIGTGVKPPSSTTPYYPTGTGNVVRRKLAYPVIF